MQLLILGSPASGFVCVVSKKPCRDRAGLFAWGLDVVMSGLEEQNKEIDDRADAEETRRQEI